MEESYKTISVEEFVRLDLSKYTLVDLREPDEALIGGIPGAVNIPFSQFSARSDAIPKDKPVLLYCHIGEASEQIAELLANQGYDAAHLAGGYLAYRRYLSAYGTVPDEDEDEEEDDEDEEDRPEEKGAPAFSGPENRPSIAERVPEARPDPEFIDAKGLKCPGPIVKVADYLREKPEGTRVRVEATEDAFYSDVRIWCERTGNRLDDISFTDGVIRAEITRAFPPKAAAPASEQNDKTFVVFSGDLDKTIAAFIMATGAAAMDRKVTVFFTFWGLNILRRPNKVKVRKPFIEKMFGWMMPRGTGKLGLSRMNMGGLGAKMIRGIMKSKGVSSLEELIDSARAHGVRLVACQMSMDIMGIRKEELIDGVELGGVSTFLGSGEHSDMSLFI